MSEKRYFIEHDGAITDAYETREEALANIGAVPAEIWEGHYDDGQPVLDPVVVHVVVQDV